MKYEDTLLQAIELYAEMQDDDTQNDEPLEILKPVSLAKFPSFIDEFAIDGGAAVTAGMIQKYHEDFDYSRG